MDAAASFAQGAHLGSMLEHDKNLGLPWLDWVLVQRFHCIYGLYPKGLSKSVVYTHGA